MCVTNKGPLSSVRLLCLQKKMVAYISIVSVLHSHMLWLEKNRIFSLQANPSYFEMNISGNYHLAHNVIDHHWAGHRRFACTPLRTKCAHFIPFHCLFGYCVGIIKIIECMNSIVHKPRGSTVQCNTSLCCVSACRFEWNDITFIHSHHHHHHQCAVAFSFIPLHLVFFIHGKFHRAQKSHILAHRLLSLIEYTMNQLLKLHN